MAWVHEELERRGAAPSSSAVATTDLDGAAKAFREKVVKRAWEIMRELDWLPVESNGQAAS